jgi:hypothetical protein
MLHESDGRIYKRVGYCCRCGFCCRNDMINYNQYSKYFVKAADVRGSMLHANCERLGKDGAGLAICKDWKNRGGGCRHFPWHPLQLSNTERGDLPRIPRYKSGRMLTMKLVNRPKTPDGITTADFKIDQADVTEDDTIIVGWEPFSTVCTYMFVDVTEDIRKNRPYAVVKPFKDPVIIMRRPRWLD